MDKQGTHVQSRAYLDWNVFPEFAEVKTMESKLADLILVKVTEWISQPGRGSY